MPSFASKLLKILSVLATIAYPFVIVFANNYFHHIVAILAILWALRASIKRDYSFFIALFFAILFFVEHIKFLYPLLVNVFFASIFASSLKDEAIITKFARLKKPDLPLSAVIYTRRLTKIWIAFFITNGLITAILWFASEGLWAIYCGVVSYILVGVLFLGEMIFRRFYLGR